MTIKYNLYGSIKELTASPELLNHLGIVLDEAANYNDSIGCHDTADQLRKQWDCIFQPLFESGFYD